MSSLGQSVQNSEFVGPFACVDLRS
jgi:hypothetical protein